jgi:hypothetical protein
VWADFTFHYDGHVLVYLEEIVRPERVIVDRIGGNQG